jgi:hypothetical protein
MQMESDPTLTTDPFMTAIETDYLSALSKDAGRYRWLKEQYRAFDEGSYNSPVPSGMIVDSSGFDEVVDEERHRAGR